MPLTNPTRDLSGRTLRRLIEFDNTGESEPILFFSETANDVQRYWIRKVTFTPAMLKEPVFYTVNGRGERTSIGLPEHGMQALIDSRAERLAEHIASLADMHKTGTL